MKDLHKTAIDALLEDAACTRPCKLIFKHTKWTTCPNCVYNAGTRRSSNVYLAGGPIEFYSGTCPYCHGDGRTSGEETSELYMMPLWNSKDWVGNIITRAADRTDGAEVIVQTMSFLNSLDDLKRASSIVIDTALESYTRNTFHRIGEPMPCGFGASNYIFTSWGRIDTDA